MTKRKQIWVLKRRMKRLWVEAIKYKTLYGFEKQVAKGYEKALSSASRFIAERMKKTCNTCTAQANCPYCPPWGEDVRWNCAFYTGDAARAGG